MSKLSLHISDWLDPDIAYEFIGDTKPPIVKVFGNVGLNDTKIGVVKQRSPLTTVVGRMFFNEQGIERDEKTPKDTVFNYDAVADAANAFNQMREIMDKLRGLVDVWEGYNEIPIDTDKPLTEREFQKARNYNAFTVEMARLLHQAGMKFAAYSFSTGNPVHVELWDLLVEGLRASDYLALHEYIAPNKEFTEFNTTMCNRYRDAYARVPADARKPVLITECGVDFNGEQGYKGKIALPEYMSKMAAYDRELMRDPYVIGATIFCYGIDNARWKTYDIGGNFTRILREHILATPTPPIEIPPVVEPPPVTPPVVAPPSPPVPAPGLLRLIEVFGLAKQARDLLQNGEGQAARTLLKGTVVPWFLATEAQHSSDLPNALAHREARWFGEESIRRIEAGKNDEARQLLEDHVLTWLASPGPRELGILGIPAAVKRAAKPVRAKKGIGTLSAGSSDKRSAKKSAVKASKRRRK